MYKFTNFNRKGRLNERYWYRILIKFGYRPYEIALQDDGRHYSFRIVRYKRACFETSYEESINQIMDWVHLEHPDLCSKWEYSTNYYPKKDASIPILVGIF